MLGVKFLRVRHRQLRNNREMVLSTEFPHLMSTVTTYTNQHKWEDVYKHLTIDEKIPSWKIGKADNYRCFTVWYGSLEDINERDFSEADRQSIKSTMKDMAEFYLTQLSEGNLRALTEKK